jgi:ankyrin repeat protein
VNGLPDRGAPLNGHIIPATFDESVTTVKVAVREGRLALLKRLIQAGAFRQGGKAMVSAALRASVASQRADVVAEVLKYHPDINCTDRHGDTAMARIFTGGHPRAGDNGTADEDAAIIHMLAKAGGQPDLPNPEYGSLLILAFAPEKIGALVSIGADLEKRDSSGDTPLLSAADEDTALALMQLGASPLARNRSGQTFAEIARQNNCLRVIAAIDARAHR